MNMLTISAAGLIIFSLELLVTMFGLRRVAQALAASSNPTFAQMGAGLAALIH